MIGVGISPAVLVKVDAGDDWVDSDDCATRREDMSFTQDMLHDKIHTGDDGTTYKYIGAIHFPAGCVPSSISVSSVVSSAHLKLETKSGSGTCSIDLKADLDEAVPSTTGDFDSVSYDPTLNYSAAYPGNDTQITINIKSLIDKILETDALDTNSTLTIYLFDDTTGSPHWEFDNTTDSGDFTAQINIVA